MRDGETPGFLVPISTTWVLGLRILHAGHARQQDAAHQSASRWALLTSAFDPKREARFGRERLLSGSQSDNRIQTGSAFGWYETED